MAISFKKRVGRRDLLIGTILTLPAPELAEILGLAGFDWLFVDLEHSTLDIRGAQAILQAAASKIHCVIRVPANDETWIKKCLDIGADGIIVPHVLTADDAQRAVGFCKYPPEGSRSIGVGRAQGYGVDFRGYLNSANDDTAVILQIEHADALPNLSAICGTPGIDGLFVGPYDLSASMGKTGLTTDAEVQKAISAVKQHADSAGIPLGIFGVSEEAVKPYIETGYTLIAVGIDTLLFEEAAGKILHLLRE